MSEYEPVEWGPIPTPSLKGQLAERLKEVELSAMRMGKIMGEPDKEVTKRMNLASADECIRQMEWARKECKLTHDGWLNPLTLAPDDWKP